MRESKVEDYLIRRVREKGGETRKVKWIGRDSAPDRIVLLPKRHFFAELKRPGKDAEDKQAREHERLRKAGCEVHVLDTFEAVDAVL